MATENTPSISELIRNIQSELIKSEEIRIKNKLKPLFETESCEIEIKFTLTKETKLSGKASLYKLIAVTGGKNISKDQIHTVKLKFKINRMEDGDEIGGLFEESSGRFPRNE